MWPPPRAAGRASSSATGAEVEELRYRLQHLEGRVGSVEKLSSETASDVREILNFVRVTMLGPSRDPVCAAIQKAKSQYNQLEDSQDQPKGSPQPYMGVAAIEVLRDDEELTEDMRRQMEALLQKLEELACPLQCEKYIQTFRVATTRDQAVVKGHFQFSMQLMSEFPHFVGGGSRRQWNHGDGR
jgi:hypothetical protein